ncbi:Periplasmic hemin-binding protein [Photobacterium marinum]|uniref:Periplasmic hemin-binding protein n=1 Tax=Photobacterium marinum TaxID=1056511 RepID=L8JFU0_9GAMM|nr:ABC transporter substrate-binding protein [Photobacterium marinum]ELR67726.1 Periplasmic hemin-binding protein [Photobacterium marinum]
MRQLALATALFIISGSAWANERIISAGATITELIYALNAQEQIVAVDATSRSLVDDNTPKLGYHRQLSAESLIALNPTRILGSDEMGPETTLNLIRQTGIKVNIVNSGETVHDLKFRIAEVGKITGKEKEAEHLQAKVQNQVNSIFKRIQSSNSSPKKVLFLMLHEGRPANVAGRNTTADTVIKLAGAINPAASFVESYKPISVEAMVQMQPDIILVSSRTMYQISNIDGLLSRIPLLAATPAGQTKSLASIDGAALIGGLGLLSLSEAERLNKVFYEN